MSHRTTSRRTPGSAVAALSVAALTAAALLTGSTSATGTDAAPAGTGAPSSRSTTTSAAPRTAGGGFTGAVDVDGCSGALVRLRVSRPQDRALVLTAGHCYEGRRPVPGEVIARRASHRLVTLLDRRGRPVAGVHATTALYVTMTGTDMALYELGDSYRRLEQEHGVTPLTVADRRPESGAPLRIVSGSQGAVFDCHLEASVYRLLETGYLASDAIRYSSECATRSGTSGSPVLSDGVVVAVNSTSNAGGTQCTEGNPCEMDRNGVITARAGASYGTQVSWLSTCMRSGNVLDLDRRGCLLPRPDLRQALPEGSDG